MDNGNSSVRDGIAHTELMNELIFLVEEAAEGGFTARALGESIFTEAETLDELRSGCARPLDATSRKEKPRR